MVVLGNLIALVMIAGGILNFFLSFLNLLGILTIGFVGVMIADYYLVRRGHPVREDKVESVNVAGMVSIACSTAASLLLESTGVFAMGFLSALVIVLIAYPLLRLYVLPPGFLSRQMEVAVALQEEA
ncbi:MAG: hypothetical protein JJ714_00150 [Acidithiobacillus sp.]|nr:hypothetical protein [Acidithiobacillus sp.]